MKPPKKADRAGRRTRVKRASAPRNPFKYSHWVSGWARPFESRWSVYQKYAWINSASPSEHSHLMQYFEVANDSQMHLDARLFAAVPAQHRALGIRLWGPVSFRHAVCPDCLAAGYWSELPQLAGCDHCPIHGTALQRHCRRCLRALRFGCPQFTSTGAYVCRACGEPLTAFPTNACLQWHSLSADTIASRMAPLDVIAQRVAVECDGRWHFPAGVIDRQLVLNALTGHRMRHAWDENLPLIADGAIGQVIPVTFRLPCDESVLVAELEDARRALVADLTRYCNQSHYVGVPGRATVSIKLEGPTHELAFRPGGSLLENVTFVLESLLARIVEIEKRKNLPLPDGLAEYLGLNLQISSSPRTFVADPISKILWTFSVWQVVRVLLWLESLTRTLLKRFDRDGRMTDEIEAILRNQPYGIRLRSARIDERQFVFGLSSSSWTPPYRMRTAANETELTIFQIIP
jgi:hypothetical protein